MTNAKKILVVDVDSDVVLLCQSLLETRSYLFLGTTDPNEALEMLGDQKIDLLLLDFQSSGINGKNLFSLARSLQPDLLLVALADNQAVEAGMRMLVGEIDGLVIKPVELGLPLIKVVENLLETGKRPVNPSCVQSMIRLGSTSLLNTTQKLLEKQILDIFAETFSAANMGIYHRPGPNAEFMLISVRGKLPSAPDPFWKIDGLQQFQITNPFFRWIVSKKGDNDPQDLLDRFQWSTLLVVTVRRRKEQYLFLAARNLDEPAFNPGDLDWMLLLATQAIVAMENVLLFSNVAGLVQRVEKSGGILQRAEKMNVVERVMPALVHEINTVLQSIKNNLYLAGHQGSRNDRVNEYLTTAQRELYRSEGMVQRLLSLVEPDSEDAGELDLEAVVKQVLSLYALKLREGNIQVRTTYSRPVPTIKGERDKIELVFLLILLNSLDALAGVSTEKTIWIDVQREEYFLQMVIEDSGAGFPESMQSNLMKPFVTSKPKGLGMGLVVSQRIIEAQGGNLSIIPARHGRGACIEIYLPCGVKNA
jgi:signal transduction histidine kinase/CheY-like chemotaxis protein